MSEHETPHLLNGRCHCSCQTCWRSVVPQGEPKTCICPECDRSTCRLRRGPTTTEQEERRAHTSDDALLAAEGKALAYNRWRLS